jgi:hypothetical protein
MPKHDVRLNLKTEIPIGNVDLEIPVYIDGALRGRLEVSTGSIDWRRRNARKPISLSWTKFAELMEANAK